MKSVSGKCRKIRQKKRIKNQKQLGKREFPRGTMGRRGDKRSILSVSEGGKSRKGRKRKTRDS